MFGETTISQVEVSFIIHFKQALDNGCEQGTRSQKFTIQIFARIQPV